METDPILEEPANARERILAAAAALVASGGSKAATTRAVAAAAGVQAPTLYRLFGDKDGLLAAVAEQVMANFVAAKVDAVAEDDPVLELRRGWDDYIAFGLSHSAVFALMNSALKPGLSSATAAGLAVLARRVHRVARAGWLRVAEERAVDLIHACGTGAVLALIAKSPGARDDLAAAAREAVMAAILDEPRAETSAATAMATGLRARLDDVADLTPGERHLLDELLQRIARACG